MSQDMTLFNSPNAQNALAKLQHDIAGSGKPFLKFGKDGSWVYGVEETRIKDGDRFAVNTASIQLGYIAWYEKEATEVSAYLHEKAIEKSDLADVPTDIDKKTGKPKGWQETRAIDLKMLTGARAEMHFKTSSAGGKEAFTNMVTAILQQASTTPSEPVAIVQLTDTSYKHPEYGKIYKPVFEIVDWMSMEALTSPNPAAMPAGEPRKALV